MFDDKMPIGEDYRFSKSESGAHQKLVRFVGSKRIVLDVGCASGYLAAEFKKNGCRVFGIEGDAARAASARESLEDIIVADIDCLEALPYPEGFFDCIVFADILEHLKRPDVLLENLKKYLKKDGFVVVSVPNIARIDVRLGLLFGKFEYAAGGILDKTHLRFFTAASLEKLLISAGYAIIRRDFTGLFSGSRVFRPLAGLLAFQFIVAAKPLWAPFGDDHKSG